MTIYETTYRNGRRELALHCLELLKEYPERKRILSHVFWENACCGEDGIPQYLFYSPAGYRKMNVQSFDELHAPAVESAGGFKRLCVTTNWVLDMASFGCFDGWFAALSDKNRKKLRWLRNALPKQGIRILPVDGEEAFRKFEQLYAEQFPKYAAGSAENNGVWTVYQELIRLGRNFSWIMLDENGSPVTANLGYLNGETFNFTHLTRKKGLLDKFSPGFYLTYWIVRQLYAEHPEVRYFFMGPGKYDYKPAFLAKPLPVYRYERDSILNLFGLMRLHHRLAKERKQWNRKTEGHSK